MALGIIFKVSEPKRAYHLEDHVVNYGEFSDTVSSKDFKTRQRAVALISFDGETIAYAALVSRGQRVATAKYRLQFTRLVELDELTPEDLRPHVPQARLRTVSRYLENDGGTLSPETWGDVFNALKKLRPDVARELDSLVRLAEARPRSYRGGGYEMVAEEKDAFLLATEIFGIKRKTASHLLEPPRELAPFLKGLSSASRIEDIMIQKDKATIPDWIAEPESQVGSVVLTRKDGRQLTVVNVNRTPIEETLGVDLIYYNHAFRSYVLVQYKVMESDEDAEGNKHAIYRPIDRSYKKEVARMERYLASRPSAAPTATTGFRLAPNGFLFKLCPRIASDPLSTTPIAGMYIPFDYWKLLLESPSVRGPKGGIQITYDNVGRYLNNGLFVSLVEDGWLGTPIDDVEDLSEIIQAGLEGKRSVMIARSSGE